MEPAARLMSKVRTIAAASYRKSVGKPDELPAHGSALHGELPAHDVLEPVPAVRARSGVVVRRARPAADAACRSRAELLDVDGAHGRLVAGQPLCIRRRRRLRAVGSAARRRQRRGHRDARRSCTQSGEKLERSSPRSRTRTPTRGSWASATASTRTSTRARRSSKKPATPCSASSASTIRCSISRCSSRKSRSTTRTSSSASCIRTSTTTAASSCARSAFPTNMFTVLFAIGRLPGWIAHWREVRVNGTGRIDRPRQIYTGATLRALRAHRAAPIAR